LNFFNIQVESYPPHMTPVTQPFFTTPSPAAHKLETLRQLFPSVVEVGDKGSIRVNAAALQMALDPTNPAGVRVEEDGYEMRWVGKRKAYHQAGRVCDQDQRRKTGQFGRWHFASLNIGSRHLHLIQCTIK